MTLRGALEDAARGDASSALARVDEVLERATPVTHFAAAHVLRTLGRHARAFASLERAAEEPRLEARVRAVQLEWHLRLGRLREARRLVADHPSPRAWARLAEELASAGCDARALSAIEAVPEAPSVLVFRAALQARLGRPETAMRDVERALELRRDASSLLEGAEIAIACGDFARAERFARTLEPDARAAEILGRLALFRGERVDAVVESAVLRGGDAVLRGEMESALQLLADDESSEANAFRAEALLALGRPREALAAADRAVSTARGSSLAGRVLQHLCRMELETVEASRVMLLEVEPAIRMLAPGHDVEAVMSDLDAARAALREVLRALRGNRTVHPTHVVDGRLMRANVDGGPRFASRAALQRIVFDDDADVIAALDAAIDAYPESALPLAHRGEAHLWLGSYREARRDLEEVVARFPHTRWPYIGLTALEIVEGNYEQALATCALGVERMRSEGPAVFVHRGEALRRLGRKGARADLERACALHPGRISAAVNLALLHLAEGELEPARAIHRELAERADGLLDDAATAAGKDDLAAILERALVMMRGNRSTSAITYFAGDVLRTVVLDPGGERLREGRRRDLARAWELTGRV